LIVKPPFMSFVPAALGFGDRRVHLGVGVMHLDDGIALRGLAGHGSC